MADDAFAFGGNNFDMLAKVGSTVQEALLRQAFETAQAWLTFPWDFWMKGVPGSLNAMIEVYERAAQRAAAPQFGVPPFR